MLNPTFADFETTAEGTYPWPETQNPSLQSRNPKPTLQSQSNKKPWGLQMNRKRGGSLETTGTKLNENKFAERSVAKIGLTEGWRVPWPCGIVTLPKRDELLFGGSVARTATVRRIVGTLNVYYRHTTIRIYPHALYVRRCTSRNHRKLMFEVSTFRL
jgi:hypothetical protein